MLHGTLRAEELFGKPGGGPWVRSVPVASGRKGTAVNFGDRSSSDSPIFRGSDCGIRGDGSGKLLAFGQLAIGNGLLRLSVRDFPIRCAQSCRIGLPSLCRHFDQELTGGGGCVTQLMAHDRRGPAAESAGIKRGQGGISHYQLNRRDRNAQLL